MVSIKNILFLLSTLLVIYSQVLSANELTPEEQIYIKSNPKIPFTCDPNWLPFEAFTPEGKTTGMLAEYLSIIESDTGLKFVPIPVSTWNESLDIAVSGKVKMISGDVADKILNQKFIPINSYGLHPIVIVMDFQHNYVEKLERIQDKKIAIIKDYGYTTEIYKKYPNIKFYEVENIQEGLNGVATGRFDAMLSTMALATYTISQMQIHNVKVVGKTDIIMGLTLFIDKNEPILHSIINKAIKSIDLKRKQLILDKWVKHEYVEKTDYTITIIIGVSSLFIITLLTLWIRSSNRFAKRLEAQTLEHDLLINTTQDGYWVVDTNGNIIDVNNAYCDISGYSKDELLSMKVSDIEHIESEIEIQEHILRIIKKKSDSLTTVHRKKDGGLIDIHATITFVESGKFIAYMRDISEIKEYEKRISKLAYYDELTNLPNRTLLDDRIAAAINSANRHKKIMACCLVDLDGFKNVNDSYGHDAGDFILVEASKRMIESVRSVDTVARMGGDEFVVLLTDLESSENCIQSLERILHALSHKYVYNNQNIDSISASVGVSFYPDDETNPETLVRNADIAMYKSKNSGKNKYSFYEAASEYKIAENDHLIKKIKKGLDKGEFILYYQPKLDVQTGEINEVEALARWNHPMMGILSPAEFIPLIMSDNELSLLFDKWVITEAFTQLKHWQEQEIYLKVCVNISSKSFSIRENKSTLCRLTEELNIPVELFKYIEYEISENDMLTNQKEINSVIKKCQTQGSTFALDDFGTGYSSLLHLKNLNVNTIKIDILFVRDMLTNMTNRTIIKATNSLANAFGIHVTAQGAETIEHVKELVTIGCENIQGYAIARPLSAESLLQFLESFRYSDIYRLIKDKNGKN